MGLISKQFLDGDIFTCRCDTHICLRADLHSTGFRAASGEAFLFKRVFNTIEMDPEERMMISGKYLVCDVVCVECRAMLGWKYVRVFDDEFSWKQDKFVIEVMKINRKRT